MNTISLPSVVFGLQHKVDILKHHLKIRLWIQLAKMKVAGNVSDCGAKISAWLDIIRVKSFWDFGKLILCSGSKEESRAAVRELGSGGRYGRLSCFLWSLLALSCHSHLCPTPPAVYVHVVDERVS